MTIELRPNLPDGKKWLLCNDCRTPIAVDLDTDDHDHVVCVPCSESTNVFAGEGPQ